MKYLILLQQTVSFLTLSATADIESSIASAKLIGSPDSIISASVDYASKHPEQISLIKRAIPPLIYQQFLLSITKTTNHQIWSGLLAAYGADNDFRAVFSGIIPFNSEWSDNEYTAIWTELQRLGLLSRPIVLRYIRQCKGFDAPLFQSLPKNLISDGDILEAGLAKWCKQDETASYAWSEKLDVESRVSALRGWIVGSDKDFPSKLHLVESMSKKHGVKLDNLLSPKLLASGSEDAAKPWFKGLSKDDKIRVNIWAAKNCDHVGVGNLLLAFSGSDDGSDFILIERLAFFYPEQTEHLLRGKFQSKSIIDFPWGRFSAALAPNDYKKWIVIADSSPAHIKNLILQVPAQMASCVDMRDAIRIATKITDEGLRQRTLVTVLRSRKIQPIEMQDISANDLDKIAPYIK